MKISVDAQWLTEEEVIQFAKLLKDEYGVDGKFFDGGDTDSFWTLSGSKEDVKRAVLNEWAMDEEEFETDFELK